jgi:peptide/nickel transport system substrate-binding protein
MTRREKIMAGLAIVAAVMAGTAQAQDRNVTIVMPSAVDVVEPCHMMSTGYIGLVLRQNIVESLITLDPTDSSPRPLLATSWERVDPLTWRVHLREGVTFHDGAPFNAAAVAATMDRLFTPELICRDKIRLFGNEKLTVNQIDDYTVDFVTERPNPLMPITLAQIGMTSPKMGKAEASRHPIGTGPYVFTSWNPAESLVFDRNLNYWGKAPQIEHATYVWRSERALRASMVEVGEADIGMQIAPQDANNPDTDFGYLNADTARARIFMDDGPLDDVRIRKALNLAVDRGAFVGTILSKGVVPASQYMLPNVNGYNPDLTVWPYDPEKAKALVEEARSDGVPVDNPIALYGSDFIQANATEIFQALVQYWQAAGLNVQLQMVDKIQHAAMRRKPYPNERPTATMVYETHDNTAGDAFYTMMVYYHSNGQLSNISDPKIDGLLDKGAISTGEERTMAFREANRIIREEIVPDVMLWHLESFIRVGPRVSYKPDFTTQGKLELSAITFKE